MRDSSQRTISSGRQVSLLAFTYAVLAAIATVTNIATQDASLYLYSGPYYVPISVLAGTVVGLVVKYCLDKRYIFAFKPRDAAHDLRTFVVYAVMGVATTVIFWAFEFSFDYLFHTKEARFLGGSIGLVIGYITKYALDRRFVFGPPSGR